MTVIDKLGKILSVLAPTLLRVTSESQVDAVADLGRDQIVGYLTQEGEVLAEGVPDMIRELIAKKIRANIAKNAETAPPRFSSNMSREEFEAAIGQALLRLSPAELAPYGITHERVRAFQAAGA